MCSHRAAAWYDVPLASGVGLGVTLSSFSILKVYSEPLVTLRTLVTLLGDPQVWIGDPQVWLGDPQVWIGDPQVIQVWIAPGDSGVDSPR